MLFNLFRLILLLQHRDFSFIFYACREEESVYSRSATNTNKRVIEQRVYNKGPDSYNFALHSCRVPAVARSVAPQQVSE